PTGAEPSRLRRSAELNMSEGPGWAEANQIRPRGHGWPPGRAANPYGRGAEPASPVGGAEHERRPWMGRSESDQTARPGAAAGPRREPLRARSRAGFAGRRS